LLSSSTTQMTWTNCLTPCQRTSHEKGAINYRGLDAGNFHINTPCFNNLHRPTRRSIILHHL
jgi:hypothetical protein